MRSTECGAVVQLVRTPACHAGGREFKSRPLRHFNPIFKGFYDKAGRWCPRRAPIRAGGLRFTIGGSCNRDQVQDRGC